MLYAMNSEESWECTCHGSTKRLQPLRVCLRAI
jgi:hypothetical protein